MPFRQRGAPRFLLCTSDSSILEEYKKFAIRGNVIDMAVGIIIGAAFGTVVQSLVKDILTPPLGLLTGGTDFQNLFVVLKEGTPEAPYATLQAAQEAGAVTINMGLFVNALISFLIVSFAVFLLVRYNQPAPGTGRGPTAAEDDQEVPVLCLGRAGAGDPLPALHL